MVFSIVGHSVVLVQVKLYIVGVCVSARGIGLSNSRRERRSSKRCSRSKGARGATISSTGQPCCIVCSEKVRAHLSLEEKRLRLRCSCSKTAKI